MRVCALFYFFGLIDYIPAEGGAMPFNIPTSESAGQIIGANLAETDKKQTALFEIRLAHIRELANDLAAQTCRSAKLVPAREYWGGTLTREMIEDVLSSPRQVRVGDSLAVNSDALYNLYGSVDIITRVQLCREIIARIFEKYGAGFEPADFLEPEEEFLPEATGRISYVKNSYTDTAYTAASVCISRPSAAYAQSYAASCDDVNAGRCEFCILPVESSADGKLLGFYSLIDKYDLKIVLAFNVSNTDGSITTKFALCRRNISDITPAAPVLESRAFAEIRFLPSDGYALCDILNAARCLGLTLRRVDSMPLGYTDSEFAYNIIFGTDGADIICFLAFLAVWTPHYVPVGFYREYSL